MGVGGRVRIKNWRGKAITAELTEEFRRRLFKAGAVAASHCRRILSTSSRANGPSSPGDPPHADTGRLRNSVTHDVVNRGDGELVAVIGTNVEYAPHLQFGTKNKDGSVRISPRPFIDVAVYEKREEIKKILDRRYGKRKK